MFPKKNHSSPAFTELNVILLLLPNKDLDHKSALRLLKDCSHFRSNSSNPFLILYNSFTFLRHSVLMKCKEINHLHMNGYNL